MNRQATAGDSEKVPGKIFQTAPISSNFLGEEYFYRPAGSLIYVFSKKNPVAAKQAVLNNRLRRSRDMFNRFPLDKELEHKPRDKMPDCSHSKKKGVCSKDGEVHKELLSMIRTSVGRFAVSRRAWFLKWLR